MDTNMRTFTQVKKTKKQKAYAVYEYKLAHMFSGITNEKTLR